MTVYTSATCGPCHQLRYLLDKNGYKYSVKDISENPNYVTEIENILGYKMTPLTVFDDGDFVQGPNFSRILEKLKSMHRVNEY